MGGKFQKNSYFFTLDVTGLYPSIKPEFAIETMKVALLEDQLVNSNIKEALLYFVDLIFTESFIVYQDNVYTSLEGIPTGNCISRQVADITLHWLLFVNCKPRINLWDCISFWRKFIDDIFGRWHGTIRQFKLFVDQLNRLSEPFGIKFGEHQIGKQVNFLDGCFYIDEENQIQYKLYRKETDARLYVRTDSYHPPHTFASVAFSQMIRVINRNSKDETCVKDMEDLQEDLKRSGHKEEDLLDLIPQAVLRCIENDVDDKRAPKQNKNQLVFSITYFREIAQLKKMVRNLDDDIKRLCGNMDIIFALKKNPAIRDIVVKNKRLSSTPAVGDTSFDHTCGARGCLTCRLMFDKNEVIMVNGLQIGLKCNSNCKSKHIIYIAQCQLCAHDQKGTKGDTYFGQTVSPLHIRVNGHRSKFNPELFEKSALSIHCRESHYDLFDIDIFKFGVVKQVKPTELDREEERFIDKFKTNIFGLNRIKVVR